MLWGRFIECLSPAELQAVRDGIRAAVEGEFFPEWEFSILIGATRDEVRGMLASWPRQTFGDEEFEGVIRGVLVNLAYYPHGRSDELARYVHGGREEVRRILAKLNSN